MRPMRLHTRAAAWLVTGPVGHFAAGLADWLVLLVRYWTARARGRSLDA
jgi:hypothetical protein